MNKLTLSGATDFALTTDALAFMQEAYASLERLAGLGGDNYILSGCVVTGTSVSSGWMVLKGQLIYFTGGTIQTNVRIVETIQSITVDIAAREQKTYHAEFGTSSNPALNVAWTSIGRYAGNSVYKGVATGSGISAVTDGVYYTEGLTGLDLGAGTLSVRVVGEDVYQHFVSSSGYPAYRVRKNGAWQTWREPLTKDQSVVTIAQNQGWDDFVCRYHTINKHVTFYFYGVVPAGQSRSVLASIQPDYLPISLQYGASFVVPAIVNNSTTACEVLASGEVKLGITASAGSVVRASATWLI